MTKEERAQFDRLEERLVKAERKLERVQKLVGERLPQEGKA